MIRHCVFVRFKPATTPAVRQAIYDDLEGLRSKLRGMGVVNAGANVSPEGMGKGFDAGFTIDFSDAAARDAYLVDPDHQAIGARIVAAAQGGTEGILVFDLAFG